MAIYTSGEWHVKAGQEEAFATKWRELSEGELSEIEPDARLVLMRDRERPLHFRSFGEFRNDDAIVRWRDGCHFGERIGELMEFLNHAETSTFDVVESLGIADLR